MKSNRLRGEARLVLFLVGCAFWPGCSGAATRVGGDSHSITIDFRPNDPKLIDVRLDEELLVMCPVDGAFTNWDPLERRLKGLFHKAKSDGQKGTVTEIDLVAGDRVPYEIVGSAMIAGFGTADFPTTFHPELRAGKQVALVMRRPESPNRKKWKVMFHRVGTPVPPPPPPEPGVIVQTIRIDLFHAESEVERAAGRYTMKVDGVATDPAALPVKLEELRHQLVLDGRAGSCAVLISPDMAIWHKHVLETCRAALDTGFEIAFTVPK